MTSRLNGAGVISGYGVPTADIFPRASSDGTPLYLDLDSGILYYLDDSNVVQQVTVDTVESFGVGAIYLSVDSTNPNTTLGYGTWARFGQGRMLISLDEGNTLFDTPEETGGYADAIVVAHTHTQDPHTHIQNSHSHTQRNRAGSGGANFLITTANISPSTNQINMDISTAGATATNQNTTAINQSTGISGTDRNYPPFIAVYMWKRTA